MRKNKAEKIIDDTVADKLKLAYQTLCYFQTTMAMATSKQTQEWWERHPYVRYLEKRGVTLTALINDLHVRCKIKPTTSVYWYFAKGLPSAQILPLLAEAIETTPEDYLQWYALTRRTRRKRTNTKAQKSE